jgi:hypothetical protein
VGIEVRAVDAATWDDVASLFGPSGAYSGCWCMWWRIKRGHLGKGARAGSPYTPARAPAAA